TSFIADAWHVVELSWISLYITSKSAGGQSWSASIEARSTSCRRPLRFRQAAAACRRLRMPFDQLYRRDFITLIGGPAAPWPLAARAQQPSKPVIGFMSSRSPEDSVNVLTAFRRGLGEGGLIEGENVAIEFRWARGAYQELPALAAELVSRRVAVLVAVGGDPSALAAKAATSSIPIVFNSTDPIKSGLVASLNRPGGNATGVYILTSDLEPKRLGLLHELFPGVGLFGVMLNPKFPAAAQQAAELAEAARTIGRPIILLNA